MNLGSVYVSNDGVWKLGGMECAGNLTQPNTDFINKCRQYMDTNSIPPEEKVTAFFYQFSNINFSKYFECLFFANQVKKLLPYVSVNDYQVFLIFFESVVQMPIPKM